MDKVELKREGWAEHDRRWRSSGMSVRAYCEREGLGLGTFEYWRRRLRGEQASAPKTTPVLTLVPARMAGADEERLEVRGPDGWHISLPGRFEVERLAALLKALK
jgi:hypothetical protein